MTQRYAKPPITEAVIEWRFASPTSADTTSKISGALALRYPLDNQALNFELKVNEKGAASFEPVQSVRRFSLDNTELVVIGASQFSISQLAPYTGWDVFKQRCIEDWGISKSIAGYRKLVRVGVRYINRIDIPATGAILISDYVNIFCSVPKTLGIMSTYLVQATSVRPKFNGSLIINSALAQSPLVGYHSVLLDLDLNTEVDIPQRDADMFDLLDRIRSEKNEVFEACITDKTRELFF